MQQLSHIDKITQISKKIIRILGMNPSSMCLQGTNTYLIGEGKRRILVDAGQNVEEYYQLLKSVLEEQECMIDIVLITHNHKDHVLGIEQILRLNKNEEEDYKVEREMGFKYIQVENEQIVRNGDGVKVRCLLGGGHSWDHCAFYYEEEQALLIGDTILGEGSAIISDLSAYFLTLQSLLTFLQHHPVYFLLSAHGQLITSDQVILKVNQYLQHRQSRNSQILQSLSFSPSPIDIHSILLSVYPNQILSDPNIHQAALNNLQVHLNYLILSQQVLSIPDPNHPNQQLFILYSKQFPKI